MADFREIRAPLLRSKSATHSPILGLCSGEIPPELSPLDELAKQGRLLKRQLEGKNGLTLTPQSVHKSLRRSDRSPGSRSPLERSFSLDSQGHHGADRRLIDGFGIHFPNSNDIDRPQPRLSTVPSEVSSNRDSTISNNTSRPESTISSIAPPHFANSPNLYNNSDHHSPIKEFESNTRDSVKPSIENVLFEEPDSNRSSGLDRVERLDGQIQQFEMETPPPPIRHDSGHEVPESERIPDKNESSGPLSSYKPYVPANASITTKPPSQNGKPQYQAFSYARFTATRQNSNGANRFGSLSSQNSFERDKFGPLSRQDSDETFRTPPRTNSYEQETSRRLPMQNSNDRDWHGPPARQNSENLERAYQKPSPPTLKTSATVDSIIPQISAMTASSPKFPVSRDSHAFHSSPSMPISGQRNQGSPNPEYPRSTGFTTDRPPSVGSDKSAYSQTSRAPSKGINFSRPILTSRPSIDGSSDTQGHHASNITSTNGRLTPMGFDGIVGEDDIALVTSDYTYSKYQLPRGRNLSRNSRIFQEHAPDLNQEAPRQPEHAQPGNFILASSVPATIQSAPINLPTSSNNSPIAREPDPVSSILRQTNPNPLAKSSTLAIPGSKQPSPHGSPNLRSNQLQNPWALRLQPSKDSLITAASLSAEEHVTLGIELHEKGSLQESSYHLRCAANAGNPTGMLLYALALRHGWGMKPNQKEGVAWLKKVTQFMSSEVADAETTNSTMDLIERKGRKAEFALGIYELGVSHLNGWGTEQDKSLALRCFEIAGKWGDSDALAEAGYCYANGVGCKKDMKKSAKFYRMAEAKGINMVGNSWIWKDKYLDEAEKKAKAKKQGKPDPTEKEKHSHGTSFFHRKKNTSGHH